MKRDTILAGKEKNDNPPASGTPERDNYEAAEPAFTTSGGVFLAGSDSSLASTPDFGQAWIDEWNEGFSLNAFSVKALTDKANPWALLDRAYSLDEAKYTKTSYAVVTAALQKAEAANVGVKTSQKSLDDTCSALKEAIRSLELKPGFSDATRVEDDVASLGSNSTPEQIQDTTRAYLELTGTEMQTIAPNAKWLTDITEMACKDCLPLYKLTRAQVKSLVFDWIETYYNRKRRHTANAGNLPPLM